MNTDKLNANSENQIDQELTRKWWHVSRMTMHRPHHGPHRGPHSGPHHDPHDKPAHDHEKQGHNPFHGQGRMIYIIMENPGITQKELAEQTDMSQQAVSELLIKLEEKGHIVRTPSEEDKRVMTITVSPEGIETRKKKMDKVREESMAMFNCLSEDEKINLIDYLTRIETNLAEKMPESPHGCNHGHHDHEGDSCCAGNKKDCHKHSHE